MQFCADNGGLNVSNWINQISRHGEPGVNAIEMPSRSDTVGVMLVHGVLEGEDPQIVTAWIGLGNPDYTCFIPAWVSQGNNLSPWVTSGDPNNSIAGLSEQLFMEYDANQYDQYINNLIRPLEDNIIEAVAAARAHWLVSGFSVDEAIRIHIEASDSAWNTMSSMAAGSGRTLNMTPRLTAINELINGSQVAFDCEASDDDGVIVAYEWDFGDNNSSTNAAPIHSYNSAGTYLVRCRVVDNNGSQNSRWKYITVIEANQAPVVTISAPADGATFNEGDLISFSGSASDVEDGDLSDMLAWTSSLDGAIGTGGSFSRSDLSVGVHTISAEVTDSGGASHSALISVIVYRLSEVFTEEVRITAGTDDAEETPSGGMYMNSSDIELVYDDYLESGDQTVGLRFNEIDIAQGATILNAYVQFQVDETTSEATSLAIFGEYVDDAGPFLSTARNISTRQKTSASVVWSPVAWTNEGEAGVNQQTPDIASVIQEIVGRAGWSSGNSLVIIVEGTGRRVAESFEGSGIGAALLHIEYALGPINESPTVTINTPTDGATFSEGESVSFNGTATDVEDGDLSPMLTWTSNLDGSIGTGGSFSRSDLSLGTHTITAAVVDSGGTSQSSQINIIVYRPGEVYIEEERITSGSDDAEETPSGGMYMNSSDIELVYDDYLESGDQTVGLRFSGIDIPQGATIVNAYVQFQVDETTAEATSLTIFGENVDDAGPFLSTAVNISTRLKTAASVAWTPVAWTNEGEAGVDQQTPDIASIIQEIVGRSGWTSGNSLVIIVEGTGRRVAESFEGAGTGAVLLHVEYSIGPVNLAPVVSISSPNDGSSFIVGESIMFVGSANDAEDGDLSDYLSWTSSIDGNIGTGISFTLSNLSVGIHIIMASVTDSGGHSSQTQILVTINETSQEVARGPYLQSGTSDSIVIRWRTHSPTDTRVRYGIEFGNLDMIADDPMVTTEHEINLIGLNPATRYYYSIGSTSEVLGGGSSYYFETAPMPGSVKKSRIWVLSDTHGTIGEQNQVRDAYYDFTGAEHTDLWLIMGDLSTGGSDSDYQNYLFESYQSMLRKSVLWPSFGNRDNNYSSSTSQTGPYYEMFTLPTNGEAGGIPSDTKAYYSFNFANIHFISLNSVDVSREINGPMLNWLQSDLASNTMPWVIVFWHHPPYSKGVRDSDIEAIMIQMRENVVPLLENYGVDLVLGGHSHSYERSYLIDGHYGASNTLTSEMILDNGSGRIDGDGAYVKPSDGMIPHQGTVYMVASTSSTYCSSCLLDHPAMFFSSNTLGSVIIDVDGNRADVTFLDRFGTVRDYFTIDKSGENPQPPVAPGNLSAQAESSSSVNLTWEDNSSDENGFYIERKTGTEGFALIDTVGQDIIAYTDTNLTPSTTYTYRVQAFRDTMTSVYSNEASVTTDPENQAPNVTINSPGDGATINEGDTINFDGTASDAEDGDITANITWTSSIDGAIGMGGSFSRSDLSEGIHTISASVTDSGGLTNQSQITLTVLHVNQVPTVTITAPADDSSYNAGQLINFSGTASDPEDGDMTASLSWTSSIDGAIGTGGSFSRSDLSEGVHTITASVTDSEGLSRSAQISITVYMVGEVFTEEVRVTAGSDDAEEKPSGEMYLTSSDLELVYDDYLEAGNQTVGIRFNGIDIPQGATILDAYVQFKVDESSSEATSLMIQGEDVDNAGPFLSTTNDIFDRERTTAEVPWSPVAWTVVGEADTNQRTPDITSVIQEIIDRPGWSNGNSLVIIIRGSGSRVAESYEGDPTGAPLLHIEYSIGPVN